MATRTYTPDQKEALIRDLIAAYGVNVTRKQILDYTNSKGMPHPFWLLGDDSLKSGRGMYTLRNNERKDVVYTPTEVNQPEEATAMVATVTPLKQKKLHTEVDQLIPSKDKTYVPFGFFRDLKSVIKSKQFYPIFITGLSGNGKTTMVEQVCAELNRECVRVNISIETDEDDLIGGNTLVDGNVVYREGPVLIAMKRGAVVILDEIDRGSNKLMCLQAILEGKPYFNKKTGEVVHPAIGFNIVATANTKGRGTEDGKFIAAQILDEAFLERFPITVEQEYPTATVEKKIVLNNMRALECEDDKFADKLVSWAEIIRKTFIEGGTDEIISTRRLVHIVKAFSVFKDRQKAIQLCINRFDDETKTAFFDLYTKIDTEKSTANSVVEEPEVPDTV